MNLRDLTQRFDPDDRSAGLRLQAALVAGTPERPASISLRAAITAGAAFARIRRAPLKVVAQNTALMPDLPITLSLELD